MDINSIHSVGRATPSYTGKPVAGEVVLTQSEVAANPDGVGEKNYIKSQIEREINGLNKWLQANSTHLRFQLHEKLNEYYVQVVDDQTQTVIREIPSRKVMDMVAYMYETIGILVDEKR